MIRLLLMLIGTTGFEAAGLIIWFELHEDGRGGLGLIILFTGLVLERLVISGIPRAIDKWLVILGSAWWEYAAWALWFTLIQTVGFSPILVFALVLLPGLHFQHSFIISVSVDRTFGKLAQHPGFIIFSLIEAIGGGIWLAALTDSNTEIVIAHLIIIIAITIEHLVQGFVINMLNQEGTLSQVGGAN